MIAMARTTSRLTPTTSRLVNWGTRRVLPRLGVKVATASATIGDTTSRTGACQPATHAPRSTRLLIA